jgi:dienelactone hydrolase
MMSPLLLAAAALLAHAAEPGKLIEIPGATIERTDAATGVHLTVTIGSFLISSTEVTQREFEAVMARNPSYHKGPLLPVENVTWWDAIRYANLLSVKAGLPPCYDLATGACDARQRGYRLPTDAEWTLAAGVERPTAANLGSADTVDPDLLLRDLKTAATKPAGSYPPNRHGLYDMLGNVWEWCNDYFDPAGTLHPDGPAHGLARVIRGGSFISTTSSWARGYRSSMEPSYKSRFTGFRLCRTGESRPAPPPGPAWFAPYNQPPAGYETTTGDLAPLLGGVSTLAAWTGRRKTLEAKWSRLLGSLDTKAPAPAAKLVEAISDPSYHGQLMYLQVEPDWWEKILIMMPPRAPGRRLPVVIVPFYDVDTPAGRDLGGRSFVPASVRSFAYLAVRQGCIAVAIRWFGESYGESYTEAVANLLLRHPRATGLGKWVWDARRLLDYLATRPEVDPTRVAIMGHSLGGKMALYAAAFDPRIRAAVASEPGIGLKFSNYDSYWYLTGAVPRMDQSTDQHELLALIAPRPFLLLGGDQFDTARSWHYINAARQVYELYGRPRDIGYFNHHQGHSPTPEAVTRSMDWLARALAQPE